MMGLFDKFKKKNESANDETRNPMLNLDDMLRDSFLVNEAKFQHQTHKVKRSSPEDPIDLEYILRELLEVNPDDVDSMTLVTRKEFGRTETTEHTDSRDEILKFSPFDKLLYQNSEGKTLPESGLNLVIILSYRSSKIVYNNKETRHDKSVLCTDSSIILFCRAIGAFLSETAYMRVSVMIPNFGSPDDFRGKQSNNSPFTMSFIIGYDITPPEKRIEEYQNVEKSLIEKANQGMELSKDERTILEGIYNSHDWGYNFGYGKWLIGQKRFTDALLPLTKVFEDIKSYVATNPVEVNEIFSETCYWLGFIYNELGLYEKAIYYLDFIQNQGNIIYIIEYINALVNSGDPRSMSVVRFYLLDIDKGKLQANPEELMSFKEFLFRRLSYIYIEARMFDKARGILEKLINFPGSHDYAVNEIRFIDHLEGKQPDLN